MSELNFETGDEPLIERVPQDGVLRNRVVAYLRAQGYVFDEKGIVHVEFNEDRTQATYVFRGWNKNDFYGEEIDFSCESDRFDGEVNISELEA